MTQEVIETAFGPVYVKPEMRLGPTSPAAIEMVQRLTNEIRKHEQLPFVTEHMLHAGMYTRTVRLPPGTVCAAALIKVPTVLIVMGACKVYSDGELIEVNGYTVLPGSKGRKIAFVTVGDVAMSMMFPTDAKTAAEAEKQFTDEHDQLVPLSREAAHRILITGE